MAVDDTRDSSVVPSVPTPRTALDDASSGDTAPRQRRTRPLSQYWDVETVCWRSTGPAPGPRRGE